jgi:hypothetical protein
MPSVNSQPLPAGVSHFVANIRAADGMTNRRTSGITSDIL